MRVSGATGRFAAALTLALAAVSPAFGQDRGAVRTHYQAPVYPENLAKTNFQGNVNFSGRIDAQGKLTELRVLSSSHADFIGPAAEAVKAWQFRPAMRAGKPIEIFANITVRFRMEGATRGVLSAPILGDLAIAPADGAGKATAPEGFPLRRGTDPSLRADVLLDVPPSIQARTMALKVEAVSPGGKHVPVFQPPVAVAEKATELKIPIVVRIGPDWEEGVWQLRFTADGAFAGAGLFWLATDPEHFHFEVPSAAHKP